MFRSDVERLYLYFPRVDTLCGILIRVGSLLLTFVTSTFLPVRLLGLFTLWYSMRFESFWLSGSTVEPLFRLSCGCLNLSATLFRSVRVIFVIVTYFVFCCVILL